MPLPYKFKIEGAGCLNNCSESSIKDLGPVGVAKGWRGLAGGFASGLNPRLADVIAANLVDAETLCPAEGFLDWFEKAAKKAPGKLIDDIGLPAFKAELGLSVA